MLLPQQFSQFLGQSLAAQVLTHHHALGVDEIHRGNGAHLVEVSHTAIVEEVMPRELLFLKCLFPIGLLFVDGDAHDVLTSSLKKHKFHNCLTTIVLYLCVT